MSLIQAVANLTNRFNQFSSNAKTIEQLPEQNVLDVTSKIHVMKLGVSKQLEISKIVDLITNETDEKLSFKLDASSYNDRFKGKFTTLGALQTAFPTANAGDYAQVDAGAGSLAKNYNYDIEDGWVLGGIGSGATNTDGLIEGSSNLYFTGARVLATVLTGISFLTGAAVLPTDTILIGVGKLQKQITDIISNKVSSILASPSSTSQYPNNAALAEYFRPTVKITLTGNISTTTLSNLGFPQDGRNVILDNGATARNLSIDSAVTATYFKTGTAAITFVQGTGRTLVLSTGSAIMNGLPGSVARVISDGTTDYLSINNL